MAKVINLDTKFNRVQNAILAACLSLFFSNSEIAALTGHYSMPEYRSFEPVSHKDMVNPFDGSFVYTIPLLDIPNGYPIVLSYHSSLVSTEADAGWVGLGWSLNPGAINRIKRGFPDEFNGEEVTYHSKIPANWTAAVELGAGLETFTKELKAEVGATIRYNNYIGIGVIPSASIRAGLPGIANLKLSYHGDRFGFQPSINPIGIYDQISRSVEDPKERNAPAQSLQEKFTTRLAQAQRDYSKSGIEMSAGVGNAAIGSSGTASYSFESAQERIFPGATRSYSGWSVGLKFELGMNFLPLPVDPELRLSGSYVRQNFEPIHSYRAYGYWNLENACDTCLMDYQAENQKTFHERDRLLGYPLPNSDIFCLSGEAIGGSFRAIRADFGHYRKPDRKSTTIAADLSADVNLGSVATPTGLLNLVYSLGGSLSGNYGEISSGNWDSDYRGDANVYRFQDSVYHATVTNTDERFVLRYSGDLISTVRLSQSDAAAKAKLKKIGPPGLENATPDISGAPGFSLLGAGSLEHRVNRSSYVGYNLNSEFSGTARNSVRHKVRQKTLYVKSGTSWIDYNSTERGIPANGIGEFYTFNKDGALYVYGLPVYTRNEKQLHYGLDKSMYGLLEDGDLIAVPDSDEDIDTKSHRKIGYECNTPYASQFLLTQITSPDYLDRTFDGPTFDDYGSFTKFDYVRIEGGHTDPKWYTYRSPFSGLNFDLGSLSDNADDMGSFCYGERETYYLSSVSSKTHVAFFTLSGRNDGLGLDVGSAKPNEIVKASSADGSDTLMKLERIDLYSLKDCEPVNNTGGAVYSPKDGSRPIKTIRFEYSYELCPEVPNHRTANSGSSGSTGKLTLKKVWFEYGGITSQKISPYQFSYEYTNLELPLPYEDNESIGIDGYGVGLNQNPSYSNVDTDRWGSYRDHSKESESSRLGQLARFFPYTHQGSDQYDFDPAAWCLKRVTLPSGGDVLIQYEQNDYQFVQDKRAMVMIPLSSNTQSEEGANKRYYLDLVKAGIADGDVDPGFVAELFQPMHSSKASGRLYFNFLYRLIGDGKPSVDEINAEFLEGYARISGYGQDDNGTFFVFKPPEDQDYEWFTSIDHPGESKARELPQEVCKEFYEKNRQGKISGGGNALNPDGSGESLLRSVLSVASQAASIGKRCARFDPSMSYVRLQMPSTVPKKAGGARVKRLLLYDSGKSSSDIPTLYGDEFIYRAQLDPSNANSTWISSGVATNEPSVGRKECALVSPLSSNRDSDKQAILYGEDIAGNEGPLGESLLPSPSIGYSRVEKRSIHQGNTSTGYEVYDYYTCRDHPLRSSYTSIERKLETPKNVGGSGGTGAVGVSGSYTRVTPHLSQGFSFVSNDMHGKQKSIRKYAAGSQIPMSATFFEYFEPSASVRVTSEVNHSPEPSSYTALEELGGEAEILSEMCQVKEYVTAGSVGVGDVSAGVWVTYPMPVPVTVPVLVGKRLALGCSLNESILRTHVTTKVISQTGVLKRTLQETDGVKSEIEYAVFDKNTGAPIVKAMTDEFGSKVYEQQHRASWVNFGMGQVSRTEKRTLGKGMFVPPSGEMIDSCYPCRELETSYGRKWECPGYPGLQYENPPALNLRFAVGDLIQVHGLEWCGSEAAICHILCIDSLNARLFVTESALSQCYLSNLHEERSFASISVLKSGLTNQLNAAVGELVSNYAPVNSNATYTQADGRTYCDCWPTISAFNRSVGTEFEPNIFETGERNKWRASQEYSYRDIVSGGDISTAGRFAVTSFPWQLHPTPTPGRWLNTSSNTVYSTDGLPIEDSTLLGIRTTIRYTDNYTVPALIARNADAYGVAFQSFESGEPTNSGVLLDDNLLLIEHATLSNAIAHTGKTSLKLAINQKQNLAVIKVSEQIRDEGLLVRLWFHATRFRPQIASSLVLSVAAASQPMQFVASSGEWHLFEASFRKEAFPIGDDIVSLGIAIESAEISGAFGEMYIDDFRVQPPSAEMTCYVYDSAQRLLAALDDQHYALIYEYNAEGILVRKLRETEDGIKTMSETNYNTPGEKQ